MNEELFDIEGENKIPKNKIPKNKKGNIEQEVLTLEEIEKFLQEINTPTIAEYNSSDERNQLIDKMLNEQKNVLSREDINKFFTENLKKSK